MTIFDYVMLLISVVLSLGLARLLETHARLIKRGAAVRWSAVYLAWFAIVGAMHVDLWATLWAVHTTTNWGWTEVMAFFFQAVALFYGSVLLAPDEPGETIDLWQFHLENRRRYIPAVIVYTALGCWLSLTFLPTEQFLSAVYTVGLPLVAGCVLAMAASSLWAQRAIAFVMVAWIAWYFSTYLPSFRS
jgi:hypothetical protein